MSELKRRISITFEPSSDRGEVAKSVATSLVLGGRNQLSQIVVLSFLDADHFEHHLREAVNAAANKLQIEPHRTIWFAHLPRKIGRERYELVTFNWDTNEEGQLVASSPSRAVINQLVVHNLLGEFSPPADPIRVEQLFYNARSEGRAAA